MKPKRQTAAEFLAELEKDPEWVRRKQERDARIEAQQAECRQAEKPLMEDLRKVGVTAPTPWHIERKGPTYAAAVPILLEHLERPYPAMVRQGIARALAAPEAKIGWARLVELFRTSDEKDTHGLKGGLGCALAGAADDSVIGDVIELVNDPSHGENRIFLLLALAKSKDPRAWEAMEKAAADPDLTKEATFQLQRKRRRKRR